jgi:membrane-associated protease RseP (regulator of RpoE activity)
MDDFNQYDALVARVMAIDDRTLGTDKDPYRVRYRGHLIGEDSETAYDTLADLLRPNGITPLFRFDDARRHVILLVPGRPAPRPSNPWINFWFFIATLLSVGFTGVMYGLEGELPSGFLPAIGAILKAAAPFTISMLGILAAHEFGHYFVGRHHGVKLTLPYFIPLPILSPFGTMGAVINMKEQPKNRKILLDIGLAGPFAGLVVAIPVLLIGLSLSSINRLPLGPSATQAIQMEGNSILYLLLKFIRFGQLLPAPTSYDGLSPMLYWLRYFFTARPVPYGGMDVSLSPVAWAGWGGLLITALNLIPAGQLDGGHALYVLIGRKRASQLLPFILVIMVAMGFVSPNWWLWAALVFFFGRYYAEPLDEISPIDTRRKIMAGMAILLFILLFAPVPLSMM